MKLYGSPMSTAAQRAIACLYEKGLEFGFVPVDMRSGEHKKEHYLVLNPFGQVPAFEDGDLKLFGLKNMAVLSVWMEVEAHQFDPVASKLAWETVFKSFFGMTTDQAVVEENEAKLVKILDVYEKRLSETNTLLVTALP